MANRMAIDASATSFRFMALPFEVRCMIYKIVARRSDYITDKVIFNYMSGRALDSALLNTSTVIRKEAFQSFLQTNIIDIASIGVNRGKVGFGIHDSSIPFMQGYINENNLKFDLLKNVHRALLCIFDHPVRNFVGFEVLRHCPNVRELVLFFTLINMSPRPSTPSPDEFIPDGLIKQGMQSIQLSVDAYGASRSFNRYVARLELWEKALRSKMVEVGCKGVVESDVYRMKALASVHRE